MVQEDGVRWGTSTPYDDVGKTMLHDCRRWIFPLLNDSYFEVKTTDGSRKYHIEFQTYLDNTLVIRMFEYDIKIAIDESTAVFIGRDI